MIANDCNSEYFDYWPASALHRQYIALGNIIMEPILYPHLHPQLHP